MSSRYPAKDRTAIAGIGLSPYSRDRGPISELTLVLEACVAAIRDGGGLAPSESMGWWAAAISRAASTPWWSARPSECRG